MIFRFAPLGVFALLAACGGSMPDSNPNNGVGFGDYDNYLGERARRDAELQAMRPPAVPEGQVLASETMAVLGTSAGAPPPTATVAQPVEVASIEATAIADNPTISDEQNFDAVASRESIESDAERLAQNRQTRAEIAPTAVPERDGSRPNVVAFALATAHPLGTKVYRRTGSPTPNEVARACGKYASDDLAQEAFLSSGGPQRDRRGLDPDGDGYACGWDPSPFRVASGG